MPMLPTLRCTPQYDDLSQEPENFEEIFVSWHVGEKDLYQGLYEKNLLLDIGWHSFYEEEDRPVDKFFVLSVVRSTYWDWSERVIKWVVRDLVKLFSALPLVDVWCMAEAPSKPSVIQPFPLLHCKVEQDRLSMLNASVPLDRLEQSGLLDKELYVAIYPSGETLQVDWKVLDCEGHEGGPYVFRGFKIRLLSTASSSEPVIDWAAENFAELFLALQSIDQWMRE